ncbi:MAG: hypothetical protein ACP5T0_03465 [Verrucomicrobiia bacterium]
MKTKNLVKVGALVLSVATIAVIAVLVFVQNRTNANVLNNPAALKDVSVLELPAAAAQIVANAPQEKRAEVAAETIRMAAKFAHAGSFAYIASAICKNNPEVASVVLSESIAAKPEEVLPISKATIAAAPSEVQELVKVACQARPELFSAIARIADQEAPNKTEAIINGVKAGLPQLNVYIDKALTSVAQNSVSGIMDYVEKTAVSEAKIQSMENQQQQIVQSLQNQNNTTAVGEPMDIVQKTASLNREAKAKIASAAKSLSETAATPNNGARYSANGPTITPVTPPPTIINNIKPQDTTVIQPGSGRNYSAP